MGCVYFPPVVVVHLLILAVSLVVVRFRVVCFVLVRFNPFAAVDDEPSSQAIEERLANGWLFSDQLQLAEDLKPRKQMGPEIKDES